MRKKVKNSSCANLTGVREPHIEHISGVSGLWGTILLTE